MGDESLLTDAVDGLVRELRAVGVPVSVSEKIDALRSLADLPLGDGAAVKSGLRTALVKSSGHEHVFDAIFDLFFGADAPTAAGSRLDTVDDDRLRALLQSAVAADDPGLLRAIARVVVDRHAGIEPGRPVAGAAYLFRAMRAIGAQEIGDVVVEQAPGFAEAGQLRRRAIRDDVQRRIEAFRREVEAEIRRRLVADRGVDAVARTLRTPLPDDVDFLTASVERIAAMRSIVAPVARKLAARLASKHPRRRRGSLDVRRTVRASLSFGGALAAPVFRPLRPVKPDVIVLADISPSVATFAAFALQLISALRSEFASLRTFVFVDGIAEVTDLLAGAPDIAAAARRINSEARGVRREASSDYGNVLQEFWSEHGAELSRRTVVIVLGDARGNYRPPRADAARALAARTGRLYWLNPEPRAMWGSGDSEIERYAPLCDGVFECRNLRQLRDFVDAVG
jgi:uncharacterized protein